jgi:phage repressor protein C with HTH and peptisase S24 domain
MQPTIVENGKNNSKMLETRIKIAVKLAGGAKKLSENGKFAASTIYNYMKVDPVPPIDFVWMLAEAAGVRAEWLFTGQEPMYPGDSGGNENLEVGGVRFGEVKIPIINVVASAGGGSDFGDGEQVDHLSFSLKMLLELGNPDQMQIIKIEGDSMEPELASGDHVMIDQSQTKLADGLHAVFVDGHLFVKRVHVTGRLKASLVSTNASYPAFEIQIADPDDIDDIDQDCARIIGRVVWAGRAL